MQKHTADHASAALSKSVALEAPVLNRDSSWQQDCRLKAARHIHDGDCRTACVSVLAAQMCGMIWNARHVHASHATIKVMLTMDSSHQNLGVRTYISG